MEVFKDFFLAVQAALGIENALTHWHQINLYNYNLLSMSLSIDNRPLSVCLDPAIHSRLTHISIFLQNLTMRSLVNSEPYQSV